MKVREAIEVLRRMNPDDNVELRFSSRMVGDSFKHDYTPDTNSSMISSSQFNEYYDDGPYQR